MLRFCAGKILAVVLLFPFSAGAVELWGGATVGMSPGHVLHIQDGAERVEAGSTMRDGRLKELVRVSKFTLFDDPFVVRYFFENEDLVQVMLTATLEMNFAEARVKVSQIQEALTVKYGSPLSTDFKSGPPGKAYANWSDGRRNIVLFAAGDDKKDAVLNVVYQTRIADEADKL